MLGFNKIRGDSELKASFNRKTALAEQTKTPNCRAKFFSFSQRITLVNAVLLHTALF